MSEPTRVVLENQIWKIEVYPAFDKGYSYSVEEDSISFTDAKGNVIKIYTLRKVRPRHQNIVKNQGDLVARVTRKQ